MNDELLKEIRAKINFAITLIHDENYHMAISYLFKLSDNMPMADKVHIEKARQEYYELLKQEVITAKDSQSRSSFP